MFASTDQIRSMLGQVIDDKRAQGHETGGLAERLAGVPDSYDALHHFAEELANLPLRDGWKYDEPNDWDSIAAQCDPPAPRQVNASKNIEAAFLGSVCGCILGKPLEINPTLDELKEAFSKVGEWPIHDYVPEKVKPHLRHFHGSWDETLRENIRWVASDDDINYTVLGMLILEQYGPEFTHQNVAQMWIEHLPVNWTFGPERTTLAKAAVAALQYRWPIAVDSRWTDQLNPGDELCGAMIRADAYGYACAGDPWRAARLAYKDASFTHRRTGIYGTMFAAAAIAAAPGCSQPVEVFELALRCIPKKTRFYAIVQDSLNEIGEAKDWLDGYQRIHGKYAEYSHCRIYQESGTLINTLRFAESVGDGICKQVMQGNDTDSYGATAGSILGMFFGPGHLEERWLEPFNDDLRTRLAGFYDRSLASVAARMSRLPDVVREKGKPA